MSRRRHGGPCCGQKLLTENHTSSANSYIDNTYSIVLPAWNESEHIEQSLNAAKHAMSTQIYQGKLIVVDNNSTDNTAQKAQNCGATVVFEPVNQIARARNTGARASNSEWLVFVDADSLISPELLTSSLNVLADRTAIGGGSTVAADRKINGLSKTVLTLWNWWSVKSRSAAGCFLYCSREAFDHVGGFDEKQYAAEELYLSKKLRKLAKKRNQQFVIQTHAPIVTSARKLDWYSRKQKIQQVLLLLLPGSTQSKKMCRLWYDRRGIKKE